MKNNIARVALSMLIVLMMPVYAFADYGAITIDGFYDDWEDKPVTEVYHGNHPDEEDINYVSLFRDEENVYVHILFAEYNNNFIENLNVRLYTNLGNKKYTIEFDSPWFLMDSEMEEELAPAMDEELLVPTEEEPAAPTEEEPAAPTEEEPAAPTEEEPAAPTEEEPAAPTEEEPAAPDESFTSDIPGFTSKDDTSLSPSHHHQPTTYTWPFSVYRQGSWYPVGSGYYTWTEGECDEAEFYIELSSIASDPAGITEISMKITELGKQQIICVGASSAPYVGVAIAAAFAVSAVGVYTYKKRRESATEK